MRDHLRPVRLFGRSYYWHREPGQPLQLVHAAPWPRLESPEGLHELVTGMFAGPLPWPTKEETSA